MKNWPAILICVHLCSSVVKSETLNVTNYGMWPDRTNIYVICAANSITVTTTNTANTMAAGKVIEIFGAGFLRNPGEQYPDLLAIVTNVVNGTNFILDRPAGHVTTAALAHYGTQCSTGLAACVAAASSANTIIDIPAGDYMVVPPDLLDPNFSPVSPYSQVWALLLRKGGITFRGAGRASTILYGAGAWTVHNGYVNRGFTICIGAPFTNAYDQQIVFTNFTFDGGVAVGHLDDTGSFPASPADGTGWDVTHGAVLAKALADPALPFPTNTAFVNIGVRHYRGEMLKAGYDAITSYFTGFTNCYFDDGNATALNWEIGVQAVENCTFTNLVEAMEYFSTAANPCYFENNYITNCGAGITLSGAMDDRQPMAAHYIRTNIFDVYGVGGSVGFHINISPAQNVWIDNNKFFHGSECILLGGAGGQGTAIISNIMVINNLATNVASEFILAQGGAVLLATNNIVNASGAEFINGQSLTEYFINGSFLVSNRMIGSSSHGMHWSATCAYLPLDDLSNDFRYWDVDDFAGITNRLSYMTGARQNIEVSEPGSVWCLDNSIPAKIPAGAKKIVKNTSLFTLPVYTGTNLSGPYITFTNTQSLTYYWTGNAWQTNEFTPPIFMTFSGGIYRGLSTR